uniref:Fungal lipase-type domain-containing protein n=1 Tax=Chromera velia CCMP2878 TaxID=1169474 RepID=A0A0G4FGP7_9ALVE|eukprot:Cvel_16854.t1-p1 / transcript=Cvel_16854.t1 / gene=Cvel_16854 / organism=Chromera_velia_CCMP2878 / gene_product=hypothetical protein / transcript_product=hypothetical protein / location=Cvel_scaffold1318:5681-7670(-) / protein_length=630 / sequence_SO=supercontig / SO=protein_coding / is_pseudo=false
MASTQLLSPHTVLHDCVAACDLLREKAENSSLDATDWLNRAYPSSRLEKITFGLEMQGAPRVLISMLHDCPGPTMLVACPGSMDGNDWLGTNLKVRSSFEFSQFVGCVHAGFWERARMIPRVPFMDHLSRGGRLVLTGHSQGSAVAEVALLRLMNDPGWKPEYLRQVLFVGFASPLVYDKKFAADHLFERLFSDIPYTHVFHHFVNRNDIVPRLGLFVSQHDQCAIRFALRSMSVIANALGWPLKAVFGISLADSEASDVVKHYAEQVVRVLLPEYRPGGIWHLLQDGGGCVTVECGRHQLPPDQQAALDTVFRPFDQESVMIDQTELQRHVLNSYRRVIYDHFLRQTRPAGVDFLRDRHPIDFFDRGGFEVTVTALKHVLQPEGEGGWVTSWRLRVSVRGKGVQWVTRVRLCEEGSVSYHAREQNPSQGGLQFPSSSSLQFETQNMFHHRPRIVRVDCDFFLCDVIWSWPRIAWPHHVEVTELDLATLGSASFVDEIEMASQLQIIETATVLALLCDPNSKHHMRPMEQHLAALWDGMPAEVLYLPLANGSCLFDSLTGHLNGCDLRSISSRFALKLFKQVVMELHKKIRNAAREIRYRAQTTSESSSPTRSSSSPFTLDSSIEGGSNN